jgi:hypothetical protein
MNISYFTTPDVKLVLKFGLACSFEIWNTGIYIRCASTDSFTVCQRVSSVLSFLMLSLADFEVSGSLKFALIYQGKPFLLT